MSLISIAHLLATLTMTGIIWFVQIVHYPLFQKVGINHFIDYETAHAKLTGFLVVPLMTIEAITALLLCILYWNAPASALYATGLALVVILWLYTFFFMVPIHKVLSGGYNSTAIKRLTCLNWLRTLLWSIRSAGTLWLLVSHG